MLTFPNVTSEADFVRAYKHELSQFMGTIRRYVTVHGFDKPKYDAMFADHLHDLYMGLTDSLSAGHISEPVFEALALLYHKEVRQLSASCGMPFDDEGTVLAEFNRVKSVLDV